MTVFKKYKKSAYADMEKDILAYWREEEIFQKSVNQRPVDKKYVFYDGPPFITGLPHHGTLLPSIIKDVIPRYKTMCGYRVERRWGWDCHGLPAENLVEKKLNLKDKRAVFEYGLEKYIVACRREMIQTSSLWRQSIERVGRWVEMDKAYKTMDADYMESVWWVFKTLYEKGLIYEGNKVLPYCLRCGTPVAKAEIAMDNSYREVEDTSVYVSLPLDEQSRASLNLELSLPASWLIWTTTPWTLPANTAIAVHPQHRYVVCRHLDQIYVVAGELRQKILPEAEVLAEKLGQDLVGLRYQPLFADYGSEAHRVLAAEYVSLEEGTGIVHLAPAYGEEDYDLAQDTGLPCPEILDDYGRYTSGDFKGEHLEEVTPKVIAALRNKRQLFKQTSIRHNYPHCHRCQTRLIYKIHPSWFLNIQKQKDIMAAVNHDHVRWFPDHIKMGRFANIIKSAPDWNISRDRLWATPLPVWRGWDEQTSEYKTIVVGSYQELTELSGEVLEDYHRPWIDEVKFEKDGILYERVDKVLDCWFESGSMPYAQHHYPFENLKIIEDNFPADFIVEYVGQVRAWFYYLHALSVALFDRPAFLNVIVTGTIAGSDGLKMSKSLGNYTDPLELLDTYSADAYRLYLLSSPVLAGEDIALKDKDVSDMQRQLDTLRNSLEFFLLYATADDWRLQGHHFNLPQSRHLFDHWLLQRLSQTEQEVTDHLNAYNLPAACRPIIVFIDDLSNWYIRRNRKRFWRTDNDADKEAAYHTLHFTLYQLAHILAPFCPFLAEDISRHLRLTASSIHLNDWPTIRTDFENVLEPMQQVRRCVKEGLAQRAEAGIKVRQPLQSATIVGGQKLSGADDFYHNLILEELNVKQVFFKSGDALRVEIDTEITKSLSAEGCAREVVRQIQILRKKAGLEVEDRILLQIISSSSHHRSFLQDFSTQICAETLTTKLTLTEEKPLYSFQADIKLSDTLLKVSLEKK